MPRRVPLAIAAALLGAATLAGCGSSGGGSTDGASVTVVASFYPLQWVAQQVGGSDVSVSNLTATGAEPHDLELTPRDVASMSDADLVVYLAGFQPAVDDAVRDAGATGFDVAAAADLDLTTDGDDDHEHADEAGTTDFHFWLDPTRLASVGDALAVQLGEVDPDRAATYEANAKRVRTDLEALDQDLTDGLADCRSRDIVTSHSAFGYLAQRYDLVQVGISGLSPNSEPSPADLAAATAFVEDHDVRTIYFETLVSSDIAETIASETGAETAVLDPIEGLTDASKGDDYLEIMRSNLASLQAGQPCP
ncbi:MAG: zinc ABC transporter substrate-binding protein [Actinobacteria bacterium]|nr:zinc ABC transporter substrate-binding protein [Actinomycetota bacterium]